MEKFRYLNAASPTNFQPLRKVLAAKRKLQKKGGYRYWDWASNYMRLG